ncbi:MAG: PaaI family thioesterase [Bacillota bacterium]
MDWQDDGYCFCCGKDNPVGMKLKFVPDGDELTTTLTPDRVFQGWAGIVHGGILSTVMDELMAHVLIARGDTAATVKMEVSFKKPARVGEKLTFRGRLLGENRRLREVEARTFNEAGEMVAEAKGTFVTLRKQEGGTLGL